MDDYFPSEESDNEPDFFGDINEQKKYLKKLQTECIKYEDIIKELNAEKTERDDFLQQIQGEIEELQRDILYHDLNIEKASNVYAELDDLGKEKTVLDKAELANEMEKLDNEITKNLTKYINRVMFTKKVEFEDKIEKKKNNFQAVCVKFYKDDPTNEEYGQYHTQSYSFQVFGLSNDLTFSHLINLAKEHWKIAEIENFVLTDPDHHDMVLLANVPIVQYLTHENTGHALFVLRPKNVKMRELVTSQKVGITLVQENEKQSKLKEEFGKIFALLRKAKPGMKTYERIIEENEYEGSPIDGTILNFAILVTILILMILSLTKGGIQPGDERELNKFYVNVDFPSYFASSEEFYENVLYQLYDLSNTTGLPIYYHYVPIGVKRIIMNKMYATSCNTYKGAVFCAYDDGFTAANRDTSALTNTTEGSWKYYTVVPESQQINIKGEASEFKGDGFIYDFPIDKSQADAKTLVSTVLLNGTIGNYFSEASRAYIFTSMYFEPNRHIILERATLFEFTSSGIIEITDRKTYFKPDSVEGNKTDNHAQINLALLILTIVGYLLNIVLNVYKTKRKREFIVLRNLMKYVIIALVIAFYAYMNQKPSMSLEEIINSTSFMSFYKYGLRRQTAINCLTLAFFLHSLTMIRSFVFSRTVNVFLNIFAQSYKDFLAFLLIFFSVFIGFSFVWWVAFGPYHQNLETLTNTAFEIFLYFATGDTIIINYLYTVNEGWAVFLVIMTCFIVFIQLDALMMSLIQENVRYLYLKSKPANQEKLPFKEAVDKIIARANQFKARAEAFVGRFKKKRA